MTTSKFAVVLLLSMTALACAAQKPRVLDCTQNPICPPNEMCQCLPGTYHPAPSFEVDERYGDYKFTIQTETGWRCEPTTVSKDALTVTCRKKPVIEPRGTR